MRARIAGTSSQPAMAMRDSQGMASALQPRLADCRKTLRLSFSAILMSPEFWRQFMGQEPGSIMTQDAFESYLKQTVAKLGSPIIKTIRRAGVFLDKIAGEIAP